MNESNEQCLYILRNVIGIDTTVEKMYTQEVVYETYLKAMADMGFDMEQMVAIPFDAPETMHQYPEMYKEAHSLIRLAEGIKYMLQHVSGSEVDFNITDLTRPTPKRTRRFYICINNFYVKSQTLVAPIDKVTDEVTMRVQACNELESELENKIKKRDHLILLAQEKKMEADKVLKAIEEAKPRFEEQRKRKDRIRAELDEANKCIADRTTRFKELELRDLQIKQKCEAIKAEILGENERREFQELAQTNENLKLTLEENQVRFHKQKKQLAQAKEAEECLALFLNNIKETKQELEKQSHSKEKTKALQKKKTLQQNKLENLIKEIGVEEEKLVSIQDRHNQVSSTWEIKESSAVTEKKQLEQELEEYIKTNNERDIINTDYVSEIDKVKQQTTASNDECRNFQATIEQYSDALKQLLITRNGNQDKACDNLNAALKKEQDKTKAEELEIKKLLTLRKEK